jgi:MurNAc alpha-1-phosphate uridylyltransferase
MKAMILAAGRGERMRPLTDTTPKPLLKAAGKAIIQHTIEQLVAAGFKDIVINIAHLGHKIRQALGNGHQFGANIVYSDEGEKALETAGGIINALNLLGNQPFLVVNGDISHEYDFSLLHSKKIALAHLVLIPNPEHHPEGDFHLTSTGILTAHEFPKHTFSGIGLYNPTLFNNAPTGKTKLAPLLKQAMPEKKVSGQIYNGFWMDIGTPERLIDLENHYLKQSLF